MSTSDDFPFIPPWRLAAATARRLRMHLFVGYAWGRHLLLGAELPHNFSLGWILWVYLGPLQVWIEWCPTDSGRRRA